MSNVLPFTPDRISQSSQGSTTFATIESRFGDGYSQRAAAGINNSIHRWQWQWDHLNSTDYNTLRSFLETIGATGDVITWTAPGDSSRIYSIDNKSGGITYTPEAGGYYSLVCYAREEFDL